MLFSVLNTVGNEIIALQLNIKFILELKIIPWNINRIMIITLQYNNYMIFLNNEQPNIVH